MFSEDQKLEKENMALIRTYKEKLAGYKATTKINEIHPSQQGERL